MTRRLAWTLAIATLGAGLWGPVAAGGQTVTGRVVGPDGAAIARADVRASPGGAQAFTDDHGRFSLALRTAGAYTLSVRRLGFRPTTLRISMPQADHNLTVTMQPLAARLDTVTIQALQEDLPRVFQRMREHLGAVQFGPALMKEHPGLSADEILQTDTTFYPYLKSTSFCGMDVYIDGKPLPRPFPPSLGTVMHTIIPDLDIRAYVRMRDVAAIEVFRNARRPIDEPWVTAPFGQTCASLVLIWTKGYQQAPYKGP